MGERILGSETEWATLVTDNGEPNHFPFFDITTEHCHIFFNAIPSPPRLASSSPTQSQFYGNGSRIYIDTGNHCEYATPEVLGALDVVRYEKAGERIMECAVRNANEHPRFKERKRILRSFKNNTDMAGQSYGSHENYCMARKKLPDFRTLFRRISPFLISRQLFAGNGLLEEKNGFLAYHLSQRAKTITEAVTSTTTSSRPILNTRDEPHADEERYFRLHLIIGDALMAQAALFLKFGTTSLVLEMVEDGFLSGEPWGSGVDFVNALHAFSADTTLRAAPKIGGRTLTIINLQEQYFEMAKRFYETSGCSTPEKQRILGLWEKIIALARAPEPHQALKRFADWAAKKVLMESEMERRGHDWSTPATDLFYGQTAAPSEKNPLTLFYRLKSMDFQYHENCPAGLARILEKRGLLERIVPDEEIARAMAHPPDNTRALPRTLWNKKLIAEGKNPASISVDWRFVRYGGHVVFRCLDPHNTDCGF